MVDSCGRLLRIEGEGSACEVHVCMCVLDCTGQRKHEDESLRVVQEL